MCEPCFLFIGEQCQKPRSGISGLIVSRPSQRTELGNDKEAEDIVNYPLRDTSHQDYYLEFKKYYFIAQITDQTSSTLDIDVSITIPYYQDIIVALPNYTNLKNLWVVYSMLFFPTLYICYRLMKFVIERQIFKTGIRSDLPIKL